MRMSRKPRTHHGPGYYHVLNRGVEKRDIFLDDQDYCVFLKYLADAHQRFEFKILSYCLMPNHYHLFVHLKSGDLSPVVRYFSQRYAQYFNRRRQRIGPLFQDRFKSLSVDRDAYALALSRYIHLNPVYAHLVERPELYPWSSYSAYLGKKFCPEWLELSTVLGYFPVNDRTIYLFEQFTHEGLDGAEQPYLE
jgi:REP element-mobilizing transposase RayT